MARNMFYDPGIMNVDFSVFKNFTFKERLNAQFRIELAAAHVDRVVHHDDADREFAYTTGAEDALDSGELSVIMCDSRGDPDRRTGPEVRSPAPVIVVLSSPNVVSDALHLVR